MDTRLHFTALTRRFPAHHFQPLPAPPAAPDDSHRMTAVMFFFLGSWWQIFLITGLRARRAAAVGKPLFTCVWCPYLVLGLFVSALILWTAPFGLMWFSVFWFAASYGILNLFDVSALKVSKVFLSWPP
jgi:hypothetical protein